MSSFVETRFENGTLYVSRLYDAPREAVFAAWVETSKVERWWGCAQTTNVRSEIECKVGGKYNHTMTIDGVGEHPGDAVFTEYDPPARLAYTAPNAAGPGADMTVSVDFSEVDGGMMLPQIIREGWSAAFGKLGGFLAAEV